MFQDTRLGKYVNDIRRRTNDQDLSRRLKKLVRNWKNVVNTNGITPRGPGPGGGIVPSNGRQSISPPILGANSIRRQGGSLSPCSLPLPSFRSLWFQKDDQSHRAWIQE